MRRFMIRDVLCLTVVVALATAWWIDRNRVWRLAEHDRQLVARCKNIGVELEPLLRQLESPPRRPSRISVKGAQPPTFLAPHTRTVLPSTEYRVPSTEN